MKLSVGDRVNIYDLKNKRKGVVVEVWIPIDPKEEEKVIVLINRQKMFKSGEHWLDAHREEYFTKQCRKIVRKK